MTGSQLFLYWMGVGACVLWPLSSLLTLVLMWLDPSVQKTTLLDKSKLIGFALLLPAVVPPALAFNIWDVLRARRAVRGRQRN